MQRTTVVCIVLMSLAFAAPALAQPPARAEIEKAQKLIIDKTNAFRKEHKLPPVKSEKHLTAASEAFAQFMAETGKYGHTADGKHPHERASEHKYQYCIVLENIGYMFSSEGYDTEELAEGFTQGWIDSPGHRENMIDPDVVHIGVAIVRDREGKYYAVQMFGRPKSMEITFTIRNESGQEIAYSVSGEQHTLPARYSQIHSVCRPPELRFTWQEDQVLKPAHETTLTIRRTRRGELAVQEQPR